MGVTLVIENKLNHRFHYAVYGQYNRRCGALFEVLLQFHGLSMQFYTVPVIVSRTARSCTQGRNGMEDIDELYICTISILLLLHMACVYSWEVSTQHAVISMLTTMAACHVPGLLWHGYSSWLSLIPFPYNFSSIRVFFFDWFCSHFWFISETRDCMRESFERKCKRGMFWGMVIKI